MGVYALDIGGPEAAHWAHLSGEIRAISADTWLSEPASGVHTFDAAVAIVADPADACSKLSNDVSGKVVIVFEADEDSCTEAEQTERIVAAGGVAIVMVGTDYSHDWEFPGYESSGLLPLGAYYVTPFLVPEDSYLGG